MSLTNFQGTNQQFQILRDTAKAEFLDPSSKKYQKLKTMTTETNNSIENAGVTKENGKLLNMLVADHAGVRAKRAGNFNERLQNSFAKDLQTEVDKLQSLQTELLEMTDFYPDTETSLRVVDPAFNPEKWTKRYNELTLSIKLQKEIVDNINTNISNLF